MGLIVDTSVFIAAERGKFDLQAFLVARSVEGLALSAVTASELVEGIHRADPARQARRSALIEGWLRDFPIVAFDLDVARTHAAVSAQLSIAGTRVGAHDLMIAATALHRSDSVVTRDARSFPRIPGLKVEPL